MRVRRGLGCPHQRAVESDVMGGEWPGRLRSTECPMGCQCVCGNRTRDGEGCHGRRLDDRSSVEEVTDVIGGQYRNTRSVVGLAVQQPVGDERVDRAPSRGTGDAEPQRDVSFGDGGPGPQVLGDDIDSQACGNRRREYVMRLRRRDRLGCGHSRLYNNQSYCHGMFTAPTATE